MISMVERDNEITVNEGDYDMNARIYDSRLGRWLSLDPLMARYPGISPYNFGANNPITQRDRDGKDGIRDGTNATISAHLILIYDGVIVTEAQAINYMNATRINIRNVWDAQVYNGIKVTTLLDIHVVSREQYDTGLESGLYNR